MKKSLIILSVCLIVVGLALTAAAIFATNFTFDFFDRCSTQTVHEITEDFQNISIRVDTSDVRFFLSDDNTCRVVSTEANGQYHFVQVDNNTLTIGHGIQRYWYEALFSFGNMALDIYLPRSRYVAFHLGSDTGDLDMPADFLFSTADIETDTGDIRWQANLSGKLSISADTGNITLLNCSMGKLELDADTGDIHLTDTVAANMMDIETNTGDVTFDRADGGSIHVETDTGDVTGTFATEKLFRGESDTGRIPIPWDTRGGDCIVTTDTGDIKLSIAQ